MDARMRSTPRKTAVVASAAVALVLAAATAGFAVPYALDRSHDEGASRSTEPFASSLSADATVTPGGLAFAASETTLAAVERPKLETPVLFQGAEAQKHIVALAGNIGMRVGGTSAEVKAAEYIIGVLESYGYSTTVQKFTLPNGRMSRNVIAEKVGTSDWVFVLGAHMDTKSPSPGANDNASGCAALLELARVLKNKETIPSIRFVFFGTEEMIDSNPDHHHYGSRYYEDSLSVGERNRIAGMISVDMIAYGTAFNAGNMRRGPMSLVDALLAEAKAQGVPMTFRLDQGLYGWSDQEPFELAGVPAAWVHWRSDPVYHTGGDVPSHVQQARVETTGRFLQRYLEGVTESDCRDLRSGS